MPRPNFWTISDSKLCFSFLASRHSFSAVKPSSISEETQLGFYKKPMFWSVIQQFDERWKFEQCQPQSKHIAFVNKPNYLYSQTGVLLARSLFWRIRPSKTSKQQNVSGQMFEDILQVVVEKALNWDSHSSRFMRRGFKSLCNDL